ncbi:MAG: hypothetical protein KAS78_04530, partial [Candidatus Pacebacteria bacterium]|nr:hypothetical protein [Candidatus Paceibacterota bacterium]
MKKAEDNLALSENTKKLFQVVYGEQNKKEDNKDQSKIKVSNLVSKMAFYYEKIRNSVDYKEEYLLRKNAIERILKRHIVIEGVIKISKSVEISKNLLTELIRAGYLPNNKIPEKKQDEVGLIIEKYIKLRNYSLNIISPSSRLLEGNVIKAKDELKKRSGLANWIIAMAASEIEENLGKEKIRQTVASNMYEELVHSIKLPDDLPYEKDLKIQIYLGIRRNFMKLDKDMLNFILFKYFNHNWLKASDKDILKVAQNINKLRKAIDAQINHPLTGQLKKIIGRYTVFYSILLDVISKDPSEAYYLLKDNPESFERKIKNVCSKKYKYIKAKLWRASVRSI